MSARNGVVLEARAEAVLRSRRASEPGLTRAEYHERVTRAQSRFEVVDVNGDFDDIRAWGI